MNTLSDVLQGIPEEKVVALTFSDGDELWLKNFTPIDESVYDRPDLFSATVVFVVASRSGSAHVGSMIDFSVLDVQTVFDLDTKCCLLEANRPARQEKGKQEKDRHNP